MGCAPLADLRARRVPALVVAVDYGFGTIPGKRVTVGPDTVTLERASVTVGIVADGVRTIELAAQDGKRHPALVANDAFMYVAGRPAAGERIQHVWIVTGNRRVAVPFAQAPFRSLPLLAPSKRKPYGPVRMERVVHGGRVGWIERRESRGQAAATCAKAWRGAVLRSSRMNASKPRHSAGRPLSSRMWVGRGSTRERSRPQRWCSKDRQSS
jgi:hypothetical protein